MDSAPGAHRNLRRLAFKGGKFVVTFDGQKVIEASDESFTGRGQKRRLDEGGQGLGSKTLQFDFATTNQQ